MDDDVDLEAEIERELEQAEKERLAMAAAKRRPKLLEVGCHCHTPCVKKYCANLFSSKVLPKIIKIRPNGNLTHLA